MMQDHISQHIKFRHTFFDDRDYWEERNRKLCSFFIMPGGSSAGYRIARSLRFNSADSAYLNRTFAGAGDRTKWSFRAFVKRSAFGVMQEIFVANGTANDTDFLQIRFDADDKLNIAGANTVFRTSNRVFRDPTAWFDLLVAVDTSQAAASKIRAYVNGVEVTWTNTTNPTGTGNLGANAAVSHLIGASSGPANLLNAYLTDVVFVDGQQLTPDAFGSVDPVINTWVPKKYTGTYGTNGFHLDFSDNSNTTSATLGKDRSGNNNDWTPNNFSVAAGVGNDSLTDTPTPYGTDTGVGGGVRGNYCTWNPLNKHASISPTDGNLSTGSFPAAVSGIVGTLGIPSGMQAYFEYTLPSASIRSFVGVCNELKGDPSASIAADTSSGGWFGNLGIIYNNSQTVAAPALSNNDIVGVAVNGTTREVWMRVNGGAWQGGGDPVAGTSPSFTFTAGSVFFPHAGNGQAVAGISAYLNCGQRPYHTAAPSGFKALCTQNLPDPTIKKPSKGFVATTESGANIEAALAALRSGWTDYIEIFKRTDSTEGWRWRFSDDTGNYLDSSSQNAKTTFPTLSGTSYVGYAIRCDAGYPARTGEASHTNGVATTITHNLGNARALIGVKNSGAGSTDWWIYHPELTAGSLVRLNTTDNQTANTTITNVGANSFDIGSAAATGTYRWFIVAETDGFFSLGKHTGNANANGPYAFTGQDSEMSFFKELSASGFNWRSYDRQRSTYNPAIASLQLNTTAGEQTSSGHALGDFLAGGYKIRETNGGINSSGGTIIYAAFAKTAFKYARAA